MRSPHDHECRTYLSAVDYSRMIRLAAHQDRTVSEFQRHALRRYMDWIETELAANGRDGTRLVSEGEG
jgi:hypothetical protein